MNYKIMTMTKNEEKNFLMEISEAEFSKIMDDIEFLKISMLSKDYYVMLRDNVKELLTYIPNINIKNKYTLDDLNRYMYNVLGSFYALIEYYEKRFKTMFETIKKKYFDNYFEYRMMYALRVYTTHRGVVLTSYTFSFNNKNEAIISLFVNPGDLLKNYKKFGKDIKNELQKMDSNNEKIEVCNLVQGFERMMSEMQKDLLKGIEIEVRKTMKKFEPYLIFENGNAIDTYILDENDKVVEYLT
ncbi:MAG: hypothetical protein II992_09470 [Lachnospiraceae bacterium]|nr:hypothetical protein [Lachnospiraceae bacterium]